MGCLNTRSGSYHSGRAQLRKGLSLPPLTAYCVDERSTRRGTRMHRHHPGCPFGEACQAQLRRHSLAGVSGLARANPGLEETLSNETCCDGHCRACLSTVCVVVHLYTTRHYALITHMGIEVILLEADPGSLDTSNRARSPKRF